MALSNQILNSINSSSVKVLPLCVGALKAKYGRVLWAGVSQKCECLWCFPPKEEGPSGTGPCCKGVQFVRCLFCKHGPEPLSSCPFQRTWTRSSERSSMCHVRVPRAVTRLCLGAALGSTQPRIAVLGSCKCPCSFKVLSWGGEL